MANDLRQPGKTTQAALIGRDRELDVPLDSLLPAAAVFVCAPLAVGKTARVRSAAQSNPDHVTCAPEPLVRQARLIDLRRERDASIRAGRRVLATLEIVAGGASNEN